MVCAQSCPRSARRPGCRVAIALLAVSPSIQPPSTPSATPGERTVTELRLTTISSDLPGAMSLDRRHIANAVVAAPPKPGKFTILVDGVARASFDDLGTNKTNTFAFSPDGARVAFEGARDGSWFMVVDDKESKPYKAIGAPVFSPDGQRLGYKAKSGDREIAVIDGVDSKSYDQVDNPRFSPDSRHVAYSVREGGKWFVIVDGVPSQPYGDVSSDMILFSPDSRRLAYAAKSGGRFVVVLRDESGEALSEIGGFGKSKGATLYHAFSPDSRHFHYMTGREAGRKVAIVLDGREKVYDFALGSAPVSSPDSQHVAYTAMVGREWFVVRDGQRSSAYDGVDFLLFSPDSRHLAFMAKRGGQWFSVVDGQEGKPYKDLIHPGPVFSPDSQHVAYFAQLADDRHVVVVDGKEGTPYDVVVGGWASFSPDSRHVVYAAKSGNDRFVVLDGREGTKYDRVLNGNQGDPSPHTVVFDSSNPFHYHAMRGSEVYVVEESF
jgi:Tol biopolymer transport system component